MVQGELFIDEKNELRAQNPSFFSSHKITFSLDKLILVFIASVVLFALTFSFGYERGKRTAEQRIQDLTSHVETIPAVPTLPEPMLTDNAASMDRSTPSLGAPVNTVRSDKGVTSASDAKITNSVPMSGAQEIVPTAPNSTNSTDAKSALNGKYTIQVATAISKELAEKEIKKLEKKGHESFFIQKGRRYEVCVGSFESVKNAKPLLSELKAITIYSDAFVRPLS